MSQSAETQAALAAPIFSQLNAHTMASLNVPARAATSDAGAAAAARLEEVDARIVAGRNEVRESCAPSLRARGRAVRRQLL